MVISTIKGVLIFLVVSFVSTQAYATYLSIGALSLEKSDDIIVNDSLNNIEWLRWEQNIQYNYHDLQIEVQEGGKFHGWAIATNVEASMLVDAALFGSPHNEVCWAEVISAFCSFDFNADLFADVIGRSGNTGYQDRQNQVFFLSQEDFYAKHTDFGSGTFYEVGVLQTRNDFNDLLMSNNAMSIEFSLNFSYGGFWTNGYTGFVLYRQPISVYAPNSIGLLLIPLMFLYLRSQRNEEIDSDVS
jgi:hypothetical protein